MPDNDLNPVIGIDLGTTYSCIARWAGDRPEHYKLADGSQTLPSIVYIQDSGAPLVGKFARQRLIIDPPNAAEKVKRYMGEDGKTFQLRGKDYTPVEISAMILARLKEDVEKKFPSTSGFEIAGAVVTHPHYFKYPQIARTQEAAELAELPVIRLLSEPVAAAVDYGFTQYGGKDEERDEKLLVFDLGGGTFDVTVLQVTNSLNSLVFKVLGVGGDDMLGGTNFDEAFAEWALKTQNIDLDSVDKTMRDRAMAKLFDAVIDAKTQLSSLEETFLAVPNILPGQHLDIEVTRTQFQDIIKDYCQRVGGIVANTMAYANMREGDLDRTIMIGGSSRIPIMRDIVHEETGVEPWANADPDLAVCRGAAFLAAMDDGRVDLKKEVIIEEATSHALGVRAAGDKFAVLIPANRPAPVEATRLFDVASSDFDLSVYQGMGKKVTDESVLELKSVPISGVRLDSNGKASVKITFTVNEQQLLFYRVEAPGVDERGQFEF
jgi:molecular chaperone DnaK